MRPITTDRLRHLLAGQQPPCLSLYQPTHRHPPDALQDPIRYRNLLRDLENSLRERYPTRDVRALLEPLHALCDDRPFWAHRLDGLAVLAAPGVFEVFDVPRPLPALAVVADSFHLKPLLRVAQSADRYHVLCVSRHNVRLYEGNRDGLEEVALDGVPATLLPSPGEERTEPHRTDLDLPAATYGLRDEGPGTTRDERETYHGQSGQTDPAGTDTDRLFRAVDRGILDRYSRPAGLPLVLVALAENQARFRALSRNPHLLPDGVARDPGPMTVEQLRTAAWRTVAPQYHARLARLVEDYGTAKARQAAADDLAQVAAAAVAGRVGTLLVEAGRQVPGTFDPATGEVRPGDLADPAVDDLLDDVAEVVLRRDGQVVVVPADRMPTRSGLAAIYRY